MGGFPRAAQSSEPRARGTAFEAQNKAVGWEPAGRITFSAQQERSDGQKGS